jgi:hypothetical protein
VEFGAKVNKLQIDGINFIQRISFDNFNEEHNLQSARAHKNKSKNGSIPKSGGKFNN